MVPPSWNDRRRGGLTFVEILLLVGMLGLLSTAYFLFLTSNVDEVEDLHRRTQAMLMAQQVLEEARHQLPRIALAGFAPRQMEIDGMQGSMEVSPYPERPAMYRVRVTVRWKTRVKGPEHRLVLDQLVRDYRARGEGPVATN